MGADIHCYLEYKIKNNVGVDNPWCGFGGKINPGRNYHIFALMAGVRNYYHNLEQIIPLRGMPDDASWKTESDNCFYVVDHETEEQGCTSRENADSWVKAGISTYINDEKVTHPDWHSHSWCTADELEQVLKEIDTDNYLFEYYAIIDTLRSFEKQGCDARMVFWFDN